MPTDRTAPKTSDSHPLRIDSVSAGPHAGRLGMTFCPGKKQRDAASGAWDRDLEADFEALRAWEAKALVTLNEPAELAALQVPVDRLARAAAVHELAWYHLPIRDGGVPGPAFEEAWQSVGRELRRHLALGDRVVVHCKGGLGRTGTVAARLLVDLGEAPERAVERLRAARPGAIETEGQLAWVRALEPAPREVSYLSRVRGCILAGAMGDALGAPVEFLNLGEIRARFGPRGVTGYAPAYGRDGGAITDDTQMTLFSLEGMIRMWQRGQHKGIGPSTMVLWYAYRRWLHTQGHSWDEIGIDEALPEPSGWLVMRQELHDRRAPGNTCLSALAGGRPGRPDEPINDSKGCGGVMRAAPCGLYARGFGSEGLFQVGAEAAAFTHTHPTGYLTAGFLAAAVRGLLYGFGLRPAIAEARRILGRYPGHEETLDAVDRALALADSGRPATPETVESLGAGWIAEEALAIALYSALVHEDDLRAGLLLAVNHSGDSDSTGAITGNLLGALHGERALPADLLPDLEARDIADTLAHDLVEAQTLHPWETEGDPWWSRYPGW